MPDTVHHVPLTEIDDSALTRDRSGLDAPALDELRLSIAASGLRLPVELWPLAEPAPPHRYGLISGLRRLAAYRALHALTAEPRYAAIPAFLRAPAGQAEALAAMVEENEIRAPLSPWERGRIAYIAHQQGTFPTIEEAVAKLYPAASRQKRARLRSLAHVVEELDGLLTEPELLNQNQLTRTSRALQSGFGDVIRHALESTERTSPEAQWELILPYLIEAEEPPAKDAPKPRPGRPRRLARIRDGLIVRRARTPEGWVLHVSGEEATSSLVDEIIGDLELRWGR